MMEFVMDIMMFVIHNDHEHDVECDDVDVDDDDDDDNDDDGVLVLAVHVDMFVVLVAVVVVIIRLIMMGWWNEFLFMMLHSFLLNQQVPFSLFHQWPENFPHPKVSLFNK